MDVKTDIYLNQLSQGIKPLDQASEWFDGLVEAAQLDVLRRLVFFILQSGAIGKHVEKAISLSALKSTYTPCQLLIKVLNEEPNGGNMLKASLSKISNLPASERLKSFKLLVALFSVADEKKRSKGLDPEKYWWHQDISDDQVVKKILGGG